MGKMQTVGIQGDRVRYLRKNRGWTQEQLAEKLGVTRPYLTYIERSNHGQSMEILFKLKELFDVSFDYLLGCYDFDEEE